MHWGLHYTPLQNFWCSIQPHLHEVLCVPTSCLSCSQSSIGFMIATGPQFRMLLISILFFPSAGARRKCLRNTRFSIKRHCQPAFTDNGKVTSLRAHSLFLERQVARWANPRLVLSTLVTSSASSQMRIAFSFLFFLFSCLFSFSFLCFPEQMIHEKCSDNNSMPSSQSWRPQAVSFKPRWIHLMSLRLRATFDFVLLRTNEVVACSVECVWSTVHIIECHITAWEINHEQGRCILSCLNVSWKLSLVASGYSHMYGNIKAVKVAQYLHNDVIERGSRH